MAEPSGSQSTADSAPAEETKKRPISRRGLRFLKWFALFVLIAYGASNLWLSSPWGTGIAEAKLKARTGLDWEVGSMTWSPWNGFTLNDAQMLQPDELRSELNSPVIKVDRIRVQPYWSQLLRGRARPREVVVESPELTISVEMLAALAARIAPVKMAPPQINPPAKSNPVAGRETPPRPPAKPKSDRSGQSSQSAKPKPVKPQAPSEVQRPPAGLPVRLKIFNTGIRIVSISKDVELLNLKNASIDLPLLGEDTQGVIKIESMKVPGLPELAHLEQDIVWKRPYLELEEKTVNVGGLNIHFLAQLGLGKGALGRFPFLFDLAIDPQKLESVKWFERLALEVEAQKLTARVRVNGSLPSPMSWRADVMVAGENVEVKESHGSHDVVFDRMYLPAVFRQGQLRWSGVRFIGEDISVLGNGKVSMNDGVLSVTRLVVSPEVAQMLSRSIYGAGLVRPGARWWADLDTPDRKMRDLHVSGKLLNPMVDVGFDHEILPFTGAVLSTLDFIREEMKEEGMELAPLPNKELLEGEKRENH